MKGKWVSYEDQDRVMDMEGEGMDYDHYGEDERTGTQEVAVKKEGNEL